MNRTNRVIFISPHLDDAVFSCGGIIELLSQNHRVEIWTIFGGKPIFPRKSPFARWLHDTCRFKNGAELVRCRRKEDRLASAAVNAYVRHFSFLDCVYRVDWAFRPIYKTTCFVAPDPKDKNLARNISRKIATNLKEDDIVFCPLAIGNHVDHVVARNAVNLISHPWLYYYEDIPYAMRNENKDSGHLQNAYEQEAHLPSDCIDQWCQAIGMYKSQLSMVDPDGKSLFNYINRFQKVPFRFFAKAPMPSPF